MNNKAIVGMLTPEKQGIANSRWVIIIGTDISISDLRPYASRIQHLKSTDTEVIEMSTEYLQNYVRSLL